MIYYVDVSFYNSIYLCIYISLSVSLSLCLYIYIYIYIYGVLCKKKQEVARPSFEDGLRLRSSPLLVLNQTTSVVVVVVVDDDDFVERGV